MSAATVTDEPVESYHRRQLGVASNSGLSILDGRSPMHYLYWIEHPEDDEKSPNLDFGQAFHVATLEPARFAATYVIVPHDAPSRPTSRQLYAKKPSPESIAQIDWWQRWDSDHAGAHVITAAAYDEVQRMATALRNHPLEIPSGDKTLTIRGAELFDLCRKEVTIRWVDERTGVECKARVDLDCDELEFGGDLKSAADAHPRVFAQSVATYRYHQQHVHYSDGKQATGRPWKNFLFLVAEKGKVNAPAVYTIPPEAEVRGREIRDRGMDTMRRCLDSNTWPSYSNTIKELVLPTWAYYD